MRGEPTDFWGKLDSQGEASESWHPLTYHCADVAACVEALLTNTLLGTRLAALVHHEGLPGEWVARLCVLSAWHDLGKFNTGFQNKAWKRQPMAGHVREIAALFEHEGEAQRNLCQTLPMEELQAWSSGDSVFEILLASLSHHGEPVDTLALPPARVVWEQCPKTGRDPFDGMAELVAASRVWFPEAFGPVNELLPSHPEFQHFFAGIVMLADWLGSDTRFFPFGDEPDKPDTRMQFSRQQAGRALQAIGLDCDGARRSLTSEVPSYQRSFGFKKPRDMQALSAAVEIGPGPSLAILEAETGSGKTEAAYWHFLRLFREGYVDGMYFALPTRTAATQVYRRIVKATERSFPDENSRPPVVLAVPGYFSVDDVQGQRLPGFEVLWNDDESERMRYRGWAAEGPKRYLAAGIAVGTIDQVLLAGLATSHAHMRASSLSRQLLVVDEVHASDVYMTTLLEAVLDGHFACRGHAFLMSATLGQSVVSRYQRKLIQTVTTPPMSIAKNAPFPAITWQREQDLQIVPSIGSGSSKAVAMKEESCADNPQAIAALAIAAAKLGASVLVLRNTVGDCRDTQRAIEAAGESYLMRCRGKCAPHHSRYAKEDRMALDHAIEALLGKARQQRGQIAVATQTVQQSLDLDADYLITDLCPADVLLQRIGRLHRHARTRPREFEQAQCVVLTPKERNLCLRIAASGEARGDLGLGSVYEDLRILESTWRLISTKSCWCIPEDNREIVELATHPEALTLISEKLGEDMQRHSEWIWANTSSCKRIADAHLVKRDHRFGSEEVRFPSKALAGRIATRLGASDRLAVLPTPMPGMFGTTIRQFTIPSYWTNDSISADEAPIITQSSESSICFDFSGQSFVYNRLGLHREE